MLSDLLLITFCWLLTYLWQFIAFPHVARFTKNYLYDQGWAISRAIGWLAIATPIWFIGHLGAPVNTRLGVWAVILVWVILAARQVQRDKKLLIQQLENLKPVIITQEVLFFIGFFFLSIVRGFNPDILGLEKFMDAGLIISYLSSPTLPIPDMWLAGFSFNYYTFGHYLGAIATHFWGISPYLSYNILLGLVMGLVMSLSGGLVMNLVATIVKEHKKSTKIIISAGVIGSFLTAIAGNTHTIWYFLSKYTFVGYWYPDATRFIINTIHEFPSYSFIVSDLHAHVWSMVLVLTLLQLIFIWVKKLTQSSESNVSFSRLVPICLAIGTLLGLIASTSTWDGLVYSISLAVLSSVLFTQKPKLFTRIFFSGVVILLTMIVSSSPWWLNFESISEGVAFVPERSPFWQLLVLWTGHVTMGVIALIIILNRLRQKIKFEQYASDFFISGIFLTAIILLIMPEIIYIIDIYPTQPRANTMFKLTYQAFILLSICGGWAIGMLQQQKVLPQKLRFGLFLILMTIVVMVGVYPYFGYRDYYNALREYKGLDGLAWLERDHPSDFQAIMWLKNNNPDQPIILEAVGDSYTTFARASTFSGLPTVLGWRVHEWLWRGSYDIPGQRSGEVEQIYTSPSNPNSQQLLRRYQVSYILVGDKEREAYTSIDEAGIRNLGDVVFEQGTTFIVQLPKL